MNPRPSEKERDVQCPENPRQAEAAQQPGGGGAPGTGAADPLVPYSSGEGITEAEIERAGGLPGDRGQLPTH
jgi:hypothetical protein